MTPIDIVQLVAAGAGFVAGWWKLTKTIHQYTEAQNRAADAIVKLQRQIPVLAARIDSGAHTASQAAQKIEKDIVALSVVVTEREKDVVRLEGQIEYLGSTVAKQVTAINAAVANLDALWRTLQSLHPDKVPVRLSDKMR